MRSFRLDVLAVSGTAMSGLAAYALVTAAAIGFTAAMCDEPEGDASGNLFDQILGYATFTSCPGTHPAVSFALFGAFVLPWLVLVFFLLSPLFNNAFTGTIVGVLVLTGAAVVVVNFLF